MKPFMMGILKCKNCSFQTKLKLVPTAVSKEEIDFNDVNIFNVPFFISDNDQNLMNLVNSFENFEMELPRLEKIQEFVTDTTKDSAIKEFLFGTDVTEGHVECTDCKLKYPIKESILDTVETA